MNSEELNDKISKICDDNSLYESFGGKCIPYIGWYWRTVDFDSEIYDCFGILPVIYNDVDSNNKERVGFMENNKWDYKYADCSHEDWVEIKNLLEIAVTNTTTETLKAVDDKIQSLLKGAK